MHKRLGGHLLGSGKWDEIKSLFFRALEREPAEREEFLAQYSSSNPEIIKMVRGLLAANEEAGSILSDPTERSDDTRLLDADAALQFAAGDLVANRYEVTRYVARGGMGEVYEASDRDLGIVVGIKAIRPSVLSGEELLLRFKREIELARRVTHPNIGRIYDFGRHTGENGREIAFLTMEFLHGETLAQRIVRTGPFAPAEALALIRDIAAGLDAIHECGIVHRDFKTANVMLVEQHGRLRAKVMDFGLARPTTGEGTLTQTGHIGGTPPYMAPEQFENVSTPASDIYALGVVMHEVLTGIRPRSAEAKSNPLVVALDPVWARVIEKCLELDPQDRYQSGAEVLEALSSPTPQKPQEAPKKPARIHPKVWLAVSALVLALAAGLIWWTAHRITVVEAQPRHLAFLPIHTDSKDLSDQALCAGLSDTLRGDLAELEPSAKSLWVIPSSEVREIKTPTQAYRSVGANLVVAASFHRLADGISLDTELIDPKTDRVIRSDSLRARDSIALREKALRQIARLLDLQVSPSASHELAESSASEPGAFEFYEQGQGYLARQGVENDDRAIDLFTKALAKDPKYALAYAGLGQAYAKKFEVTRDPRFMKSADENGRKALSLDSKLAEVHSALGAILRLAGEFPAAEAELKKALAIEPACLNCLYRLGRLYVNQQRFPEAERSFQSMIDIHRGDWMGVDGLMQVNHGLGHLEKAAALGREEIDLAPDNAHALADLGGIYTEMGKFQDALPIFERALKVRQDDEAYSNLGSALMFLGRYKDAADAMHQAVNLQPENHVWWRNLGDSYRQLPNEKAKANDAYRTALAKASAELSVRPHDPDLLSSIALYWAHLGDKHKADRFAAQAQSGASGNGDILFTLAIASELTGDRDAALKYVASAWKSGYPLTLIENEPELKGLRRDARYRAWDEQALQKGRDRL